MFKKRLLFCFVIIFFFLLCIHHHLSYLSDLLSIIFLFICVALEQKYIVRQLDSTVQTPYWHIAKIIFRLLLFLLLYIFLHNLFYKGVHICFNFYPNISVSLWRKAFIAIAEAIGLGSTLIMAIIGVLDKQEYGISLAKLVEFRYKGYTNFIVFHFVIIIGTIFFSYASYFEMAFVCFVSLLYISVVLAKIFSFLVLETNKRRTYFLKYFHKNIEKESKEVNYIKSLINCLDSPYELNDSDIIIEIVFGFTKLSSTYLVESIDSLIGISDLTSKTIKISSITENMIDKLTVVWSVLYENKSETYRRLIIEELDNTFAKNKISDLQKIIIVLSYIKSVLHNSIQAEQNVGQAIANVQKDIFYGISDQNVEDSQFRKIAQLTISLLFWMYILEDYPSCDLNIFKNIALHAKSKLKFQQYRHIFFSFIFHTLKNELWNQLSKNDQEHFINNCNNVWNQVVELEHADLVGV